MRRTNPATDLWRVGMFAPLVIAARLPIIGAQALRPTAKGRRECARMTREKPAAAVEAGLAAQNAMFGGALAFWRTAARAGIAASLAAPTAIAAAATAPVSRRVRTNARRLTGL